MEEQKPKKRLNKLIINLAAIAVSIFVFSYAWFVYNEESDIEGVAVGTAKTNNVEISKDGENWGEGLTFDFGDNFIFNNEVTSNGIVFNKLISKNDDGTPKFFADAVAQKDYIFFDLWFKNDRTIGMFLDKESVVEPTSSVFLIEPGDETHQVSEIERKSSYGNYSADLIAASVRLAFYRYIYNSQTEQYDLESTPVYVWAPNKNIEILPTDGGYSVDMNSVSTQNYNYIRVDSPTIFEEEAVENLRDTINASFQEKNAHGEPMLAYIETEEGVESIAGIKVFMWIEGNDRDTVNALRGGKFNFTLTFAGLQKDFNNTLPEVSKSGSGISGITTDMEYSIDNGIHWTNYNNEELNFEPETKVMVRYIENDLTFASDSVELVY